MCGTPPTVAETDIDNPTGTPNLEGTVVTYTCTSDGTTMANSTCGPNGEWSTVTINCPSSALQCTSDPGDVDNATDDYNSMPYDENGMVTYTCQYGPTMTAKATCLATGMWDGPPASFDCPNSKFDNNLNCDNKHLFF